MSVNETTAAFGEKRARSDCFTSLWKRIKLKYWIRPF